MHTHTEHKQYISSSDRTCTVHVPSEKIVLRTYSLSSITIIVARKICINAPNFKLPGEKHMLKWI